MHRDHPLWMVLGELGSNDSVSRLELGGLSRRAVGELAMSSCVDADTLFERTAGNPFFVTETIAAVVARRAEVWLLEALTDGDLGALDECLQSGMLRADESGVLFRHELARLAVEAALSPDQAVMLHRRALGTLTNSAIGPPDHVRLAHHAEAAGDGPAVLRYAPAAGERAAERGSPREAQHHYWRALRFAAGIDPLSHANLLERFCELAYLSDMRAEAVGAIDEAIAIHRRRADAAREGHALRTRARLLGCIGRGREAIDTIREAVRVLAQGLRNAEIAQRLVVTPKTVDHHVSSILRKLGVNSRGQAGAAATLLGVVGDVGRHRSERRITGVRSTVDSSSPSSP